MATQRVITTKDDRAPQARCILPSMSIAWPGCQAGERGWSMSSGLALVATPAWCGTKTMSQPVER